MALSEKKKLSNEKWTKENYTQVKLSMPNAEAEALDTYCKEKGLTKAGFIRRVIKEVMQQGTQPQQEAPQQQGGELAPSALVPVDGALVLMERGKVSVGSGEIKTLYTAPDTGREYFVEPVISDDEWEMLQKAREASADDTGELPF